MPVLIIYGIPRGISEKHIDLLQGTLKSAVTEINELAIDQSQVTCLLPLQHPEPREIFIPSSGWPQSKEIIIFIDGLFDKPQRNAKVRSKLAESVGKAMKKFFPEALVEVFVRPFNPDQGFWAEK